MGYALSENKEILTIFVEDTTLPAGLALCLQQFQSISLDDPSWQEKALKAIFQRMEASPEELEPKSIPKRSSSITVKYFGTCGIILVKFKSRSSRLPRIEHAVTKADTTESQVVPTVKRITVTSFHCRGGG